MSYKNCLYKPSFLERKKELDSKNMMEVDSVKKGPLDFVNGESAGDEHQFAIDIIRQRIPYIATGQATNCFVLSIEKKNLDSENQQVLEIIRQFNPKIFQRFYNSEEQGSVTTKLFKFPTTTQSKEVLRRVIQSVSDDQITWCLDPHQFQEQISMSKLSIPVNPLLKRLIDKLAKKIVQYGYFFEQYLVKFNHPHFEFLKHPSSCQYHYYRWKCIEELFGPDDQLPISAIRVQQEGAVFIPPYKYIQPRLLSLQKRQCFTHILLNPIFSKNYIAKMMVYAIKNSNYSAQISLVLCQSPPKNPSEFILRLYIISDILHNSLALSYPGLFKLLLPNFLYKNNKRFQLQEKQRQKIFAIFKIWKQKLLIYEEEYFQGLEFTLDKLISLEDQISYTSLHFSLLNKQYQDVYTMCGKLGLPTLGSFHLYLSRYLTQQDIKKGGRIEDIYDGMKLTEDDLRKIRMQSVDVVTFHSLEYLKGRKRN